VDGTASRPCAITTSDIPANVIINVSLNDEFSSSGHIGCRQTKGCRTRDYRSGEKDRYCVTAVIPAWCLHLTVSFFGSSQALKTEAVCSSGTRVNFHWLHYRL
jgi:hypothetical protein